jgi:hypothetical protein
MAFSSVHTHLILSVGVPIIRPFWAYVLRANHSEIVKGTVETAGVSIAST